MWGWLKQLSQWCEEHFVGLLVSLVVLTVVGLCFSELLFHASLSLLTFGLAPLTTLTILTADEYMTHLDAFRQGLLLFSGGLGTALTVWVAYRTLKLEKKKEQNQRFAQAVGLLGHEAVAVRTGAIYSLQQLMVEAPETLGLTICDVLAVYVNERGPKAEWDFEQCKKSNYSNLLPPPIEDSVVPRDTLSKDILAALRALANRTLPSHLEDKLDFDLECFDWGLLYPNRHGFSAADVYASKAFFDDTKMSIQQRQPRRILKRKTLFGARLGGCDFRGVSLEGSGGVVSFSGYSPDQVAKHFRVLPFEAFKDKCITDKCITWDERTVFPDMTRRYPADGSVIKDEPSGGSSAATPPTA